MTGLFNRLDTAFRFLPSLTCFATKMPYKSSAFGCKTGYKRKNNSDSEGSQEVKQPKPTMHAFPKEQEMLQRWVRANPREDFVPTKNSRMCSLHFKPADFIAVTQDSNTTRRKLQRDKNLALRYLKKDAVPSIFPNAPSRLSNPKIHQEKQKWPRRPEGEKRL